MSTGARHEAGQAGVCDSGTRQPLASRKGRTAGRAAGAETGTAAAAVVIRTTAGKPARIRKPAGSAARRAGRPQ